MKPEIPARGGEEIDAFTSWRSVYCYLQRSGVVKKIQRTYNKRVRKNTKREIEKEINEQITTNQG